MKKANILFVLHTGLVNEQGFVGGTQLQVEELAKNYHRGNAYILYYEAGCLVLHEFPETDASVKVYFPIEHTNVAVDLKESYRITYSMILDVYDIGLVHINHFSNHTVQIVHEAKKKNIPILFTAHDFHTICPAIYLIDLNNHYCSGKIDPSICEACLLYRTGLDMPIRYRWQAAFKQAFRLVDHVITPSRMVLDVLKQHYSLNNSTVIPHGTELYTGDKAQIYHSGEFNVAFVGHLVEHKGSKIIYNILEMCTDEMIVFHSLGKICDDELIHINRKNFIKHGAYQPGELQKKLVENKIHAVALLSTCPESFSFTLAEVWQCGIPVIGCRIGAIAERIEATGAGLLISVDSAPKEALDCINKLKSDTKLHAHYAALSRSAPQKKKEDMISEYNALYEHYLTSDENEASFDKSSVQDFLALMFGKQGSGCFSEPYLAVLNELNTIKSGLFYKLFVKIKGMDIPGKNWLKRIIVKILNR